MSEIIKNAIEKLEEEVKTVPASKVFASYLKSKCQADETLAQSILNKDKNLSGLLNFIKEEAKKKATNGFCAIEESVVFTWVENYFGNKKPIVEEKDIIAAAQEVTLGASTVIDDRQEKQQKKPKKEKTEKAINLFEGQVSLFDVI